MDEEGADVLALGGDEVLAEQEDRRVRAHGDAHRAEGARGVDLQIVDAVAGGDVADQITEVVELRRQRRAAHRPEIERDGGVEQRAGELEQLAEGRRHHLGARRSSSLMSAASAPAPSSAAGEPSSAATAAWATRAASGRDRSSATVATVLKR